MVEISAIGLWKETIATIKRGSQFLSEKNLKFMIISFHLSVEIRSHYIFQKIKYTNFFLTYHINEYNYNMFGKEFLVISTRLTYFNLEFTSSYSIVLSLII